MLPIDIQVSETLQFILEKLPPERQRILEVGCGTGELALELQQCGHEVIAIDSDEENVRRACRIGVDAQKFTFPHFFDQAFDVVLFTRSLHHISPLGMSLDRAQDLLEQDGLLYIEDFSYDKASHEALAWLYRTLKLLEAAGALRSETEGTFARDFLNSGGDPALWRSSHDHDMHSALDIMDGVTQRFEIIDAAPAPYLYRYISELLPQNEYGGHVLAEVLQMERYYSSAYFNFLIGRRLVARKFQPDEPTWLQAGFAGLDNLTDRR